MPDRDLTEDCKNYILENFTHLEALRAFIWVPHSSIKWDFASKLIEHNKRWIKTN